MGLFPGVRFDSMVVAAAAGVPQADAKRMLGSLTDANLLDDAAYEQYRFHDLTRLHAREMAESHDPDSERALIVRRMLDWFLAWAGAASEIITPYRLDLDLQVRSHLVEPIHFHDPGAALDWLDYELPNVMAVACLAASQGHQTITWQLADAMWPLLHYRGHYAERLELDELALTAARDGGDAKGEAKMLGRLTLATINLSQPERAQDYCVQALSIWERLGDARRIAGSHGRLGLVAVAKDQPAIAIGLFPAGPRRIHSARRHP